MNLSAVIYCYHVYYGDPQFIMGRNKYAFIRIYYTVKYCAWLLIYYGKIYHNYYEYYGKNYSNKRDFIIP